MALQWADSFGDRVAFYRCSDPNGNENALVGYASFPFCAGSVPLVCPACFSQVNNLQDQLGLESMQAPWPLQGWAAEQFDAEDLWKDQYHLTASVRPE